MAGYRPVHFVLSNVSARENDDLIGAGKLVDQAVGEPPQKGSTNLSILGQSLMHLREDANQLDRGIELTEERATETADLTFVPTSGLSNLCARLRPKPNAQTHQPRGRDPLGPT
jgi:hypothetical protein